MSRRQRRKLVPESDPAIQQLKYEFAVELGISLDGNSAGLTAEMAGELGRIGGRAGGQNYWGYVTARDAGAVGGSIVKRLIQQAEQETQQTLL